jgi:hypothetical protein
LSLLEVKKCGSQGLFWGLNMDLIDVGEVKQIDENTLNKQDKKKGGFGMLGEMIKKLVHCCIE